MYKGWYKVQHKFRNPQKNPGNAFGSFSEIPDAQSEFDDTFLGPQAALKKTKNSKIHKIHKIH